MHMPCGSLRQRLAAVAYRSRAMTRPAHRRRRRTSPVWRARRAQVAFAEWGITVDAAGWPLHVGVAIRDGLLRAQAQVIEPDRIDPHDLLRWNRQIPFVRFAHTRDGEVWIQGDLPAGRRLPRRARRASSACSC